MKKTNLLVSIALACSLLFTNQTVAAKVATQHEEKADALKELGLFQGTAKGYELDRAPTRVEGIVMLIRLLGKEDEALASNYAHSFNDVPTWASNYVAYAYHENLSNGLNKTQFGSTKTLSAQQYATFILRALGYDDAAGDFEWHSALEKMNQLEIIDQKQYNQLKTEAFLRDGTVLMSYNALYSETKKGETLISELNIQSDDITHNNSEAISQVQYPDVTLIDLASVPEVKVELQTLPYPRVTVRVLTSDLSQPLKKLHNVKLHVAKTFEEVTSIEKLLSGFDNTSSSLSDLSTYTRFTENYTLNDALVRTTTTYAGPYHTTTFDGITTYTSFQSHVYILYFDKNDHLFGFSKQMVTENDTNFLANINSDIVLDSLTEIPNYYTYTNEPNNQIKRMISEKDFKSYPELAGGTHYIVRLKTKDRLSHSSPIDFSMYTDHLIEFINKPLMHSHFDTYTKPKDINYEYAIFLNSNYEPTSYTESVIR